jgi:hypothetical protein
MGITLTPVDEENKKGRMVRPDAQAEHSPEIIRAVTEQLADAIRSGAAPDAAAERLKLVGVPAGAVDAALVEYRRHAERVRTTDIPRAVTREGIESWYDGPHVSDRYWPALRESLDQEGWEEESLSELDAASTKVLAQLSPPGVGEFSTRGLVLGHVQSGKTTNFTAVIAKAADRAYRLFIVLSGMHDSLREQTQARLLRDLQDPNPAAWHALTLSGNDFRPVGNVNAFLTDHSSQHVLIVIKKNQARLRALRDWLRGAQEDVLRACPALIVDDEADQASVNTARPERGPTAINRLIREILESLPRGAYVGYTATPFANVLMDPTNYADLYPRDFIVDLSRPASHIGPETIFGREPLRFDGDEDPEEGRDMVRLVPDDELRSLRPSGPRDRHGFAPEMTLSLENAVAYFLLSTAARRARGLGNSHATMLVHTSQYTVVHHALRALLAEHVARLTDGLERRDEALMETWPELWDQECDRVPAEELGRTRVSFDELLEHLPEVIAACRVIEDNSRSEDRLDYGEDPVTVIAVGGNTLSRGLTLEGLTVSFFVRSANAYDTLLQMGRWFGYREGYEDLPRIWMTDEMRGWFHHLATVEAEFRADIERYEIEHLTPEDVGPRIRTHPKLAITAAAKMQHSVVAEVSYSGRRLQTILFRHRDREWLEANLEAARELIEVSGRVSQADRQSPGVTLFREVPSEVVAEFLVAYRFHENAHDLQSDQMRDYIRGQSENEELQRFTVAIMGRGAAAPELGTIALGLEEEVPLINRSRLGRMGIDYADIKALMSRTDRGIDLDLDGDQLLEMNNGQLGRLRNRPERGGRGDDSGLLLLYPISRNSRPTNRRSARVRKPLDAVEHVVGVGTVFPEAERSEGRQSYRTADLSALRREQPTEDDEPAEELEEGDGS